MSALLARRRVIILVVSVVVSTCVVVVGAPGGRDALGVGVDRLRVTFDPSGAGTTLTAGASVRDQSGSGNDGVVVTDYGGSIRIVADDRGGVAADFPADCNAEPCPNAIIQVADHSSLDPLTGDFEWGARILMQPNETDAGENIVQKGLTDEPGGQWKLQVDKAGGVPSCVVSGRVPGETNERRVVLLASAGIADGVWHQVTCRRTAAAGVQIIIDGVVSASVRMPAVSLASNADVTIGAKWATPGANDQFHGILDDVYMAAVSVGVVKSVLTAASASRPAVRLRP